MSNDNKAQELKEKLILAHKIMSAAGVLRLNLGHASIRLPKGDRILIMGHLHEVGKTFQSAKTDDLSIMDLDGNHVGGRLEPPGEKYNHTGIYKARAEVNAVVHAHPLTAVACTIANRDIVPVDHYGVIFHPKVPVCPRSEQVESPELGDEIAKVMGNAPVVMLKHHGAASAGKSIEQAVAIMLILEDTAKSLLIASQLGMPETVPFDQIENPMALKVDRPSMSSNPWVYWSERVSEAKERN
ncbi:MAG: class II aldolase/adducin family protein [Nitrospinota bacterium]|jgi:ribulose-5-phosphate 4-epimerase/fuculose-1-phosphate aldolase|nr:class II aldolase/adducin family protein [Nitrospinota bacterium]MDP7386020.1 class II aldolase/adducin family protein [Nitrospinota bacterium]